MIPVPVEHLDEVRRFVLGLSLRASLGNWEEGALEKYVSTLSDDEAALVLAVTRFVSNGQLCSRVDLATDLGEPIDVVGQRVQGMAEKAWAAGLPALVLANTDLRGAEEGNALAYTVPIPLVGRIHAALDARVNQPG